ncbi:MAG: DUF3226 domain-containing protein [Patescibacteria group bacterium]|nr:DUF3226 domain-containing protein [Patescibacteria group bacterium]
MLEKCKIIVEGEGENLDFKVIKKLTKEFSEKYNLCITPSKGFNEMKESLVKISPSNLRYLLVIVDADEENIEKRFEEIKNKFNKNKFNIPIKIGSIDCNDSEKINLGIFLLPNNKDKGSMDTLVYSALKNSSEKFKSCVKLHRECFKKNGLKKGTENQEDKFNLRSIMAGLIYKNERQTKFIDFGNRNFEDLKKFLRQVK